jgi:hypothetical protein
MKRSNQVLLLATICPKFGKGIEFSHNQVAHRPLQTFISLMESYWNFIQRDQKKDVRKRLLKWFVLFVVLQSCHQTRVSTELEDAYPNVLHKIVKQIEDKFLQLYDVETTGEQEKLPHQEKHCFEPEAINETYVASNFNEDDEESLEKVDPYVREERRNKFTLKMTYQKLCMKIYKFLKSKKIVENNNFFT